MSFTSGSSLLKRISIPVLFIFLLTSCAGAGQGGGQASQCEDYPNRDIEFIVPFSPGGGYDAWARMLAPFIEENLPNDATVVVKNVTGAGGLTGTSQVYASKPDGTTIGIMDTIGVPVGQIIGEANFDVNKFTYLGRVNSDPYLLMVKQDSNINSVEDLKEAAPVQHAVTGLTAGNGVATTVVYDTFGIEFEPVLHEGNSDALLSVIRGDTDANMQTLDSAIDPVTSGEDVKAILILGEAPAEGERGYEELKDVQTIADAGYPELAETIQGGRVIGAAPDTPDCIKDALEKAIQAALNDPELIAQAEGDGRTADPLNADEAAGLMNQTFETLSEYEEVLKKTIEENR